MTDLAPASRPLPTKAAPVGTAEPRGIPDIPDFPDLSRPESRDGAAEREHAFGIRQWLRRLPAVERDVEAEERAAVQAEGRGDFGPPKPAAKHAAEVAALVRGYEKRRRVTQMISENPAPAAHTGGG